MKTYESLTPAQVQKIKEQYGLKESQIIAVATLEEKQDVWDVALLQKDTEVPHSIFTNNIVTHNSFQAEYFMSIARHVGAVPSKMSDSDANQRIFGLQDEKGNWIIKPRVKYYPMNIGEKFFDYMARLMRQLPDKLYKDGKWWLVYEPDNKLHKEHVKKKKPKYSDSLWKKTGKWWVETDNGLPQALVVTDSYPAMNPERMDVDDPSAAMAMQARMFADNIKRIKGKMSSKRVTVMGINQLRLRPGVSFGCFHANTNILLADGTTKTIKNIVDNKLEVDVLSYNPQTKKVEAQPVTGWYNNGSATKDEWLRFKVKTIVQGRGPRFDLKVTKNHLLMDAKGYLRRAHTFEVGDKFLHVPNQQQLGETQRQLFLGSVLGEGWFIPGPADLNSCGLGIAHAKQFQYLKWKYQILQDITTTDYNNDSIFPTIETVKIGDPWFIDVYTEARLGVTGLREYRVSPSLLSQISPMGLAVWAMDDASNERWQLKMQSYSIDDAQAIIDNLNSRFNLKMPFSVWADDNSKTGKGWGTNLKRDFMDLISPYVHDTFAESFERNELGIFTGYSKERDGGFYTTTAVITAIAEDTVTSSDKYDIQVANNHLYVADGVVVENSPEYEPCGEALKFNCFSADTLLQTSKGLMYADELYYETRKSEIPMIQGVNGFEQPPIYDFMGNSALIEVTTRGGFKLKGKPGHRVKALKKGTFTPTWTKLEDLDNSYYLPLKIGSNVFNPSATVIDYKGKNFGETETHLAGDAVQPLTSSVELARLLGYLVSEGVVDESLTLKEFGMHKEEALKVLAYLGWEVDHPEKQVPWIIRQGKKEEQVAFLSAIFNKANCQSRSFSYFSYSNKLLNEIQQMLLNLGIYSTRSLAQLSRIGELHINGVHAKKLAQETGFTFDENCAADSDASHLYLSSVIETLWSHYPDGDCLELKDVIDYTNTHNLIWLEVEDIEFNFEKAPTFDANMPDTHTIITNGFVSHNSDVRIRMASRSVQGGTGQFEEEPGINGGIDQYRYIHMRAAKNKLSVPNLEGWSRIWVKDAEGQAHGFDPVYDVFHFLRELGLVTGTKNKLKISIPQMDGHKPLSWLKFKKIVLGDKKMIRETLESVGVMQPFFIRQELFKMFSAGGKAMEMFFAKRKADVDKKGKDTDADSDE